jgi:hypothetical protein
MKHPVVIHYRCRVCGLEFHHRFTLEQFRAALTNAA